MGNIKVFIGEDNIIFRADLCQKLKKDPNILTIGEYIDGEELMTAIGRILPEIIFLSPRLPHLNIKYLTEVVYRQGHTKILLFRDMVDSDNRVIELLCLGIHGIISRNMPEDLLIKAIYNVTIDDEIWIDRRTTTRLIKDAILSKYSQKNSMSLELIDSIVTSREKEVVKFICQGLSNKEIVDFLCISEKTDR